MNRMFAIFGRLLAVVSLMFAGWAFAGTVNINTADADTLAANLNGVGPAKAQAIIEYRTAHGKFTSKAQLSEVKGIGEKTVAKNMDNIQLEDAE